MQFAGAESKAGACYLEVNNNPQQPLDVVTAITLKPFVVISPNHKRKQGNRHNDRGGGEYTQLPLSGSRPHRAQ